MLRLVCSRPIHKCCSAVLEKALTQETLRSTTNWSNRNLLSARLISISSASLGKKKQTKEKADVTEDEEEGKKEVPIRKNKSKGKRDFFTKILNKKKISEIVEVWPSMSIKQLAERSRRDADDIFEVIMTSFADSETRHIRSINHPIKDARILNILAQSFGYKNNYISDPSKRKSLKVEVDLDAKKRPEPEPSQLIDRPPVVTIMGHIDHGKTSLLDYLRKSRIVEGEHGGITQHIGAFTVTIDNGDALTFIDTPGHAAFTGMRSRGANVTDIVILIIDACEGVLEQTKESLRMIRQSQAPFIVALNKIDKPAANIEMVKAQLAEVGVKLEEDGGDVQAVPISALKGTNVNKLVEELLALAEMLELRCDPTGPPEGTVIESQVEHGLGKTATVLLSRGTLKTSQIIVSGQSWCRVRLLTDDQGNRLKEIKPSQAAKVAGWKDKVPSAGSEVLGVASEARAKEVVNWRRNAEQKTIAESQLDSIEEKRKTDQAKYETLRRKKLEAGYFGRLRYNNDTNPRPKEYEGDSGHPKLSVIIKGDVDGSVEALLDCLETYQDPEVTLDIVSFGVGQVTENDLMMAEKFSAVVYALNTSLPPQLKDMAETQGVSVRPFNVIYHLIHDIKDQLTDKLPEKEVEDVIGRATVLQQFVVTVNRKKLNVAGSKVVQGKLGRGSDVRVVRGKEVIYEGKISGLKQQKDEVSEVRQGHECGLRVQDDDIQFQEGDQITSFVTRLERNEIDWNPGF